MPSTQALESWQMRSATELLLANLLHRADRSQASTNCCHRTPLLCSHWYNQLDLLLGLRMCKAQNVLKSLPYCKLVVLSYASSSQPQNAMYTLRVTRGCSCCCPQVVVNLKGIGPHLHCCYLFQVNVYASKVTTGLQSFYEDSQSYYLSLQFRILIWPVNVTYRVF